MEYYDSGGSPINFHPRFGSDGSLTVDIAPEELEGMDFGYVHVPLPLEVKHMSITQRHQLWKKGNPSA
jgi:hypothetical protein